jgi:MFS family permease
MLLAAVGTFAVFDAATLSLFPIYGIQNGLDLATSANILTALILGNVLLQFPIGWLCDKFPHRFILAGCALISALTLLLLPALVDSIYKWPLLILMGTTGYGVYTVSLVSLGNRFSGIELVNGSASFAIVWGFGALIGSVSGGWAMLGFGPHGLPISLAVVYFLLAVGVTRRQLGLRKKANA